MSEWKSIKGGWDGNSGLAVYHVTKGSKELSRHDHDELETMLKSQPAMRVALDDLVECMSLWEAEGTLPDEWNKPLMRAVSALELAGK